MKRQYWAVIPSRLKSTRLPEKPLQLIAGKPLVQWVLQGVRKSRVISKIVLATDDERIAEIGHHENRAFHDEKIQVVMTDSDLPSGTDRVMAALQQIQLKNFEKPKFVFNVQGDEPLIDGTILDDLIQKIEENVDLKMITCAQKLDFDDIQNKNIVKVLLNQKAEAIYFSRFPIPFSRLESAPNADYKSVFKHIGIYGYEYDFLKRFCQQRPSEIELCESLEQLRALDLGEKIKVFLTDRKFHGVDTLEDIQIVEALMQGFIHEEK